MSYAKFPPLYSTCSVTVTDTLPHEGPIMRKICPCHKVIMCHPFSDYHVANAAILNSIYGITLVCITRASTLTLVNLFIQWILTYQSPIIPLALYRGNEYDWQQVATHKRSRINIKVYTIVTSVFFFFNQVKWSFLAWAQPMRGDLLSDILLFCIRN